MLIRSLNAQMPFGANPPVTGSTRVQAYTLAIGPNARKPLTRPLTSAHFRLPELIMEGLSPRLQGSSTISMCYSSSSS
jgi:hypothetical protein